MKKLILLLIFVIVVIRCWAQNPIYRIGNSQHHYVIFYKDGSSKGDTIWSDKFGFRAIQDAKFKRQKDSMLQANCPHAMIGADWYIKKSDTYIKFTEHILDSLEKNHSRYGWYQYSRCAMCGKYIKTAEPDNRKKRDSLLLIHKKH